MYRLMIFFNVTYRSEVNTVYFYLFIWYNVIILLMYNHANPRLLKWDCLFLFYIRFFFVFFTVIKKKKGVSFFNFAVFIFYIGLFSIGYCLLQTVSISELWRSLPSHLFFLVCVLLFNFFLVVYIFFCGYS